MKKAIYIFILLFLFGFDQRQKYPYKTSDFKPSLQMKLNQIIEKGYLTYDEDEPAKDFFRDSCRKTDLVKIMACENPLLRIVGFRALVDRNDPDYFKMLLKHLDDTAIVTWWPADDILMTSMVSDIMIKKVQYRLSQGQKDSLVDIVLRKHIYLENAQSMMYEIKPQDKYYTIIKSQAGLKSPDCHHLRIVCALAKFKRQEDVPLIKANFAEFKTNLYCNSYIFQAIEVFPDTAFFYLLPKYFNEVIKIRKQSSPDDLKYYCRAVAVFRNQSSLEILDSLNNQDTYLFHRYFYFNQEYIFKAIHKYPCPLYDSLYNELKPQMNESIIKLLDEPDYSESTTW